MKRLCYHYISPVKILFVIFFSLHTLIIRLFSDLIIQDHDNLLKYSQRKVKVITKVEVVGTVLKRMYLPRTLLQKTSSELYSTTDDLYFFDQELVSCHQYTRNSSALTGLSICKTQQRVWTLKKLFNLPVICVTFEGMPEKQIKIRSKKPVPVHRNCAHVVR